MKLLSDRVGVRRDATPEKKGLIHLPDAAKEAPKTGEVVAVGPGVLNPKTGERYPLTVIPGDRVMFSAYSGGLVEIEGEELWIISESDITMILDGDE